MNSLAETRRMTAACEECGSPDNRVIFPDGSEHCFSPSCGYHKHATDKLDKNGNPKLPPRKRPQESLDALAEFPDLPPPNAGHSYLKSHRHKGDISLRVIGDDVRQDHKWIVIAMRSPDGKVRNLQRIGPDAQGMTI